MKQFFAATIIAISIQFSAAHAENPWGPECSTLQKCIGYLHAPSACKADDLLCLNNERSQPLQPGLQIEFEKFGQAAALPLLLEILKTGNALEAERTAELLWSFDNITPDHYSILYAAWRRIHKSSIGMLATRYANFEFAKEVTAELRENPSAGGDLENTFSNFREYEGEPPNGVTAAITEHVECAIGETCDSAFALLQYAWIESNVMKSEIVGQKLVEALDNPALNQAGRIAALSFFRPSEYGRTKAKMKAFATPVLRKQLNSPVDDVRFEAASILADFDDLSGTEVLLKLAEKPSFERRHDALKSLTNIGRELQTHVPRIRKLLSDSDWDVRRYAVILLGTMESPEIAEDLIKQIYSQDWLVAYSAINALRPRADKNSLEALRRVANAYWHPIVRDAAQGSLLQDPNLSQYPAEEQTAVKISNAFTDSSRFPVYDKQDYEITQWCKSRFERDGYRFVADFITSPEVLKQANDASGSNGDHFEKMLLGLDVMKAAVKPGLILHDNGWTFVGSAGDVGVGGTTGQLAVQRGGISPKVLMNQYIAAVFLWSGHPYAVTAGMGPYDKGDGFLVRFFQRPDQTWTTENVMRLTGAPLYTAIDPDNHSPDAALHPKVFSRVWLAPDQTIGVLGNGGAMLIKPDGTPHWIGCPNPTFP
jgi:hypothetical protein